MVDQLRHNRGHLGKALGTGHGGSIPAPAATAMSSILEAIPFGLAVEFDKGVLVENLCALLGIISLRTMNWKWKVNSNGQRKTQY